MVKLNKLDCRNCKHYFVCGYLKQYDYKLEDLLVGIREEKYGYEESDIKRKLIFNFMAKSCSYFDKDCYSRESTKQATQKN